MARLSYECDNSTKDGGDVDKPFPCAADKYCFYCCCNPQCCFVIQRRPPKHFWEAWYFWLGVALLIVILLSTVGTYVVTNCKQNLQAIGYGGSVRNNRSSSSSGRRQNELQGNRNEISINIIPTSAVIPTHRKIILMAPQPSCAHLIITNASGPGDSVTRYFYNSKVCGEDKGRQKLKGGPMKTKRA